MSKQLYPKMVPQKVPAKAKPFIVLYRDPTGGLPDEVRGYDSEGQAKAGAWYHCRAVGFHTEATLFTREEWEQVGV